MKRIHLIWHKAERTSRIAAVACGALLMLGFMLFAHSRSHPDWHGCQRLGQAASDTGPIRVYDCNGSTYSEPMQ
jgi:hypothetical protein